MDREGQYQGSQAFSHIVPSENESINPNTASLNYKTPLVQLRGVRPSIDLELNMFYSFGTAGTFGLPPNWSLDLPYVLDGKSVTTNQRTYSIDYEWADITGYQSGLKYMNNHGIKFQKVVPPQELPSGLPGQYGYQLDQVDGSKDYFDVNGKPLEHHDIYDNYIYYGYQQGAKFLDFIQDSWGQKVQFQYQEASEIRVTLPSGAYTTITFSQDGILTVEDPVSLRTNFDYVPFGGNQAWKVLSSITYPTGLISRYDYGSAKFLDTNSSTKYMPYVKDHYHLDTDYSIFRHTAYDLGGLSGGNTYTGAAINLKMAGSRDRLMDNLISYEYDVTKVSYDQNENGLARTTTLFNNYHLPIRQIQYTIDNQGDFVEAYQTKYTYDIPAEASARTTSYSYPASTGVYRNVSSSEEPDWQLLTLSDDKYNEYGNLTWTGEKLNTAKDYIKTTQNEYTTTSHNIQLVIKSIVTDGVTKAEDQTENEPTEDGRAVASTTTFFRAGSGQALKPWTKRSFEYDSRGRNSSETIAWAPGATVPDGSISSVTNKISYSFSLGTLTQTGYDADNNATIVKHDMRKYSGPIMSKALPQGQVETFEYDNISRLTKHTNALGKVTTTAYTVGPTGGSQSEKSPTGYIKMTKVDILGRETDVLDNGDPTTSTTTNPTRLLSRKIYDCRSRVKESTDNLGLSTKYTYDGLDRPISVTDPKGNVLLHQYNDTGLTVTQKVNGDIRTVSQLNGRSDEIKVVTYPDSGDTSTTYLLAEETTYDGNRRPISKTLTQIPKSQGDATILEKTDIEYGPASAILSRTITGYTDRGQDKVKRQFTLDLFGNVYTWLKETKYEDGGTFQHPGPVEIYDNNNRVTVSRNQLGQEETNTYDTNGWLQKRVRFDGSQVTYTCDDAGQFIKTAYTSSATEFTYNADGRLSQVKDGADVITYQTTLDGTLTKTTYADGRTQTNVLDKYSRAVKDTDVFGVSRETQFGETGEIIRRSCKADTVTYQYGTVNHIEGQCVGYSLKGGHSYDIKVSYDGFNRLKQTTAKDSGSKTLLDTIYSIDGKGKVQSTQTISELSPDLNNQRNLVYDGLGQVIKDTHNSEGTTATTYTYDGNSNVVSKVVDSNATNMSYNKIDQRTDTGFQYDTNGRMIKDDQGYQYQFDDRDRLISVQAGAGETSGFEYRPDDYLARRKGAKDDARIYYDSGKINAMAIKENDSDEKGMNASLFSGPRALIASYTDEKEADYFLDSLGSTALLMGKDRNVPVTYEAYGSPKISSTMSTQSSFSFGQEFTDQTSGLVYLRSRYYSPKHMAFISMDRNHQENRYAYCDGDPINNIDPLGQSWLSILGLVTGAIVAGIVSFGVGFVVEAGLAVLGATELIASTAAAVIGGAAGNVAGGAVTAAITGTKYTVKEALIDAGVGAIGGLAGKAVEPYAKGFSAWVKYGGKNLTEMGQKALTAGISGAVNNGTQAIARPLLMGEPINPASVIGSMAAGFAVGFILKTYGKEYAKQQWEVRSPRVMAAARQFLSRSRARLQAAKPSEISMLTDSPVELVAFSSGRSTALASDVFELASSMTRPRIGTLSQYGATGLDQPDIPLLITEL
ncbi:hypothetical protein F4779DRAFT_640391 [Xylariaceae sp. FL0662B]|nr:hypothetical protein F4779DRAFT_640391 [Xylariaceae sp. FL0662B]